MVSRGGAHTELQRYIYWFALASTGSLFRAATSAIRF